MHANPGRRVRDRPCVFRKYRANGAVDANDLPPISSRVREAATTHAVQLSQRPQPP